MTQTIDMKYISRNSNDGSWRVRLDRKDRHLHQSYNDFEYGGKDIALKAAVRFRDALRQIIS